jgi:hypothetical protein
MEARGILSATVTIYCGLYYLTLKLNEESKYLFFAIMILVNVYFLSYWLYYCCLTILGMLLVRLKFSQIADIREDRAVDDDDDLMSVRLSKHVYAIEDEKIYTLYNYSSSRNQHQQVPQNMLELYKETLYITKATTLSHQATSFNSDSQRDLVIIQNEKFDLVDRLREVYDSSDDFDPRESILEEEKVNISFKD